MRRALWFIYVMLYCALLPASVSALEVRGVLWGFDDHVVIGQFTPIWVLVGNPGDDLFAGVFTLRDESITGSGVAMEVPGVINPGGQRWVEFTPYIHDGTEHWVIRWRARDGTDEGHFEFDPLPNSGVKARVLLEDADFTTSGAGMKAFPEERFPASVTELDALDSVVLDHMPRWEPLQRQAFLNWLYKGGTVHLGLDTLERRPEFSGELAVLNTPQERFHLGAGLVVRHNLTRRELTDAALRDAGFPLVSEDQSNYLFQQNAVDQSMTSSLQGLTRPRHEWVFIFLMGVVYLVLIGPVNWVLSKEFRDFRVALAFLGVTIAGFASVFYWVGKRGYDEVATTYTLSEASPLPGGGFDARQWSSVFVTSGGVYDITHGGPHNLYDAMTGMNENIRATITNGKDAHLAVDIPLYSWRNFLHRGQIPPPEAPDTTDIPDTAEALNTPNAGKAFGVEVHGWTQHHQSGQLKLVTGPGFPQAPVAIWVRYGATSHEMNPGPGATLVQGNEVGQDADDAQTPYPPGYRGPGWTQDDKSFSDPNSPEARKWLDGVFVTLAHKACARDAPVTEGGKVVVPDDHLLHLYVLERAPDSFKIKASNLGREIGYVLIHQGVVLPED